MDVGGFEEGADDVKEPRLWGDLEERPDDELTSVEPRGQTIE